MPYIHPLIGHGARKAIGLHGWFGCAHGWELLPGQLVRAHAGNEAAAMPFWVTARFTNCVQRRALSVPVTPGEHGLTAPCPTGATEGHAQGRPPRYSGLESTGVTERRLYHCMPGKALAVPSCGDTFVT